MTVLTSTPALKFAGALTIREARETFGAIKAHLAAATSGTRRVDLSDVSSIDTAGLQQLVLLARESRASGVSLEWVGVPDGLARAVRMLGLEAVTGFDRLSR